MSFGRSEGRLAAGDDLAGRPEVPVGVRDVIRDGLQRLPDEAMALLRTAAVVGLDREAAMALLEELQRFQRRDRRVVQLLDQVTALLAAVRDADEPGER